jgi:uncharacterized membrane protein YeiH
VETLVLALDLFGTFVFALSGAMAGVRHRLDLFGVLVLSYAAATAGGITRDVLIGAVPPASVADWRYIVVPVIAGLATFQWHPLVQRWQSPVVVFDAAGLALFAVAGALKALAFGLNPLAIGGAVACFGLRLVAIRRGWGLPVARGSREPGGRGSAGLT